LTYIGSISVPAVLIYAKDDPLVPFDGCHREAARLNPAVEHWVTEHGGHLGFLGRKPHRFWLEVAIVDWISGQVGASNSPK
jgi:predicted alpha/beta-fold hydrolase